MYLLWIVWQWLDFVRKSCLVHPYWQVGPTTQSLATVIRYTKSLSLLACGELVKKKVQEKESQRRVDWTGRARSHCSPKGSVWSLFTTTCFFMFAQSRAASPILLLLLYARPQAQAGSAWGAVAVAVAWWATSRPVLFCSVLFRPLIWPPPGPGFRTPASDWHWQQAVRVQLQATLLQGSARVENQTKTDKRKPPVAWLICPRHACMQASRHSHFLLVVRLPLP